MRKPKIGLLPFYIKLYDDLDTSWRKPLESWTDQIAVRFRELGLDVVVANPCRVAPEFTSALERFALEDADAMVTLHLAYSPSLESIEAVVESPLPVIVLDTTPDFAYDTPDKLMNNHGIHGVQDFCNLLIRRGKPFAIEAGHWQESDVLKRTALHARAAAMHKAMRNARVGIAGSAFQGMGDFSVPEADLKDEIGVTTVKITAHELAKMMPGPGDVTVKAEMATDRGRFTIKELTEAAHADSVRAGLAVRRFIEKERLTGFTMSFLEVTKASGLPAMPFLELSKAMERGIGYGGEGDVLTAALVGALMSVYPDTSFTEMFCPDWKSGLIFLSHMGEINLSSTAGRAVLAGMPWTFSDLGGVAAAAYAAFKPGQAIFADLAPTAEGYNFILAPVEMIKGCDGPEWERKIRGWMRPRLPLPDFLSEYSRLGGTHHAALVYGDVLSELASFGRMMGWNVALLGK